MGWETRRGRRYFYQSVRNGPEVRKRYLGNGDVARLAEQMVVDMARQKAAEVLAIQQDQDRLKPIEDTMEELDRACRRLIAATLLASGFHEHCRSWRKNRAARR